MIYLLFACFLMFFIFDYIQIRRATKHDRVLFPFCQLRRDIVRFLYANVFEKSNTLSPEEFRSAQRLWDLLDRTIRDYNQHKTILFNLRQVMKVVRQYRNLMQKMEPINLTENKEIQRFYQRFVFCWAKGCLAYTPLIRSELVLRLVMLLGMLTYYKALIRRRNDIARVVEVSAKIREQAAVAA